MDGQRSRFVRRLLPLAAALLVAGIGLVLYRGVLFPADPSAVAPWSSDGWGHLMKAQYLLQQIRAGNWYPDLFSGWYNGMELLRYYAPIPYYGLAALLGATGNVYIAGNWFLFLCAVFGGLSFLLYRDRIGLLPAAVGGVLFMVLPDNLRVAFAEGNIPRVVATALLPLAFFFLLNVLQYRGRRRDIAGLTAAVLLMVLSHAMMAAIFLVCMGIFSLVYWFMAHTRPQAFGKALFGMGAGVLLSFWWLLPSLVGGVTEVDQKNSSEALANFPLRISLDPLLRLHDREIFYIGLSLLLGLIAVFWFRKKLSPVVKSLAIVGLVTILVSSTVFSGVYDAIPFSYLFRPLRFLSFAGFALLLAVIGFGSWLWSRGRARRYLGRIAFVVLAALLLLDCWPSLGLVHGRAVPDELVTVASEMRDARGWREATLDLSRLGSAPSYLFTAVSDREQIFGWAYQGSATVDLTSSLNLALQEGYDTYTVDRLDRLGVDDAVVLKNSQVSPTIGDALQAEGFTLAYDGQQVDYYHRDGAPRAYTLNYDLLGIGDGAYNLAVLFPQMELGQSAYVDDYSLDFLCQFKRLLLSRFKWHDKTKAEALVTAYAKRGGRPVIDLTGTPDDVLAKEPRFLGVYGEPVNVLYQATLQRDGRTEPLLPFRADYLPWNSFTPQGLDVEIATFPYAGFNGVAWGYKLVDGARVDFLGLNLMFHAVLTHDPVAVSLLEEQLGLPANRPSVHAYFPLDNYRAGQAGYTFSMTVAKQTEVVVPVAYHDGLTLTVDGRVTPIMAMNDLVTFALPAGTHAIAITPGKTTMHTVGEAISGLVAVACLGFGWLGVRRRRHGAAPEKAPHDTVH
jgi:uncharacterized membrane protein